MKFLEETLKAREQAGNLRSLFTPLHLIDFASNDYLGFAKYLATLPAPAEVHTGATGSRLISGNSIEAETLENQIATFHQAEAGLLFNSGYDANVGLFSCIAGEEDVYLSDELIHASMIDGIRLSKARKMRFKHNDIQDLEEKLQTLRGQARCIFIAIESVYSMDGDLAPLVEIVQLAEQYEAYLLIDEAHATGIIGRVGEGLVQHLNLQHHPCILARVHTFGKALGAHGAIILGSEVLRKYLINFARSFIYTTALPTHSLYNIQKAYRQIDSVQARQARQCLQENIRHFQQQARHLAYSILTSPTAIQGIVIGENQQAKAIQKRLERAGIYAKAILSPTVPEGTERLRICLHSFNTVQEIDFLLEKIS
jgi:8-amino-7-oxononanoate synthase